MGDEAGKYAGEKIIVYDLEIKLPIDGKIITWGSFGDMGISVGVSFNYHTGDFRTYFDDNMAELVEELNNASLVVGFNQIGFDNKLLRGSGYGLKADKDLHQYDILYESRKGAGLAPGSRTPGFKLDNHLEGTFGKTLLKTGTGEQAPILYQRGDWGPLVSYCIGDVRRTCLLFEHIWNEGWVRTVANGQHTLEHPSRFMGGRDLIGSGKGNGSVSTVSNEANE